MGAAMGAMMGGQALTDMASSGLGAYFANRESNQAWSRQKAVMTRRYQWTMSDMRKAGLNPILAYQQGGSGGAAVPQTSSPNVKTSDYAGTAKEAMLMNAQLRNIEAQTAKTVAETGGIASQNEQREFYGKLFNKANQVLDALIGKFGGSVEKYGDRALDLVRPQNLINSGKSADEFKGEYVRPGLRWDASRDQWVPSKAPGYYFEKRVKGGYSEDWKE